MVCLEAEKWQGLQKRTVAVKIDVNSEPELGGADVVVSTSSLVSLSLFLFTLYIISPYKLFVRAHQYLSSSFPNAEVCFTSFLHAGFVSHCFVSRLCL